MTMPLNSSQMQRALESANQAWAKLFDHPIGPEFYEGQNYEDFCDGYLAACAELMPPDGWKCVPEEPTDDMCIAGGEAQSTSIGSWGEPKVVYWAMIAAAPSDPERQKREEGK